MSHRLFFLLAALLSVRASAQEVCSGGWQYEQLRSCQIPGEIDDGTILSGSCLKPSEVERVYKACRAEVSDSFLGCGPERYQECASMSCPASHPFDSFEKKVAGECLANPGGPVDATADCGLPSYNLTGCRRAGGGMIVISCTRRQFIAKCENDSCAVRTWKECRHSSCPLERIKYRCDEWSTAYADSCGGITTNVTARGLGRPENPDLDGRRAKDFYGTGSACLTCNDIPLDSVENVQRRFECLAKGISLTEASKTGFVSATTNDIVALLQEIGINHSFQLTPKQNERLSEILSKYTLEEQ